MKATEPIIAEFVALHDRYMKAHERMTFLQTTAIEGMRKIGVGCITEESKAEFATLQKEIGLVLAKMKELCGALY
jgi:hypothetical protein